MLRDAKKRAQNKNIPFDLTYEHIIEILTDECPIFKTAFNYGENRGIQDHSPSIDRINPVHGYTIGNVVIISVKANRIKSAYCADDLYKVADWLHEIQNLKG